MSSKLVVTESRRQPDDSRRKSLKIPFCMDPRRMTSHRLRYELSSRGLNEDGTKNVLIARLLKHIVEIEPLVIDPLELDHAQPEKWIHIANIALDDATAIEPNGASRTVCMKSVNLILSQHTTDREALINFACGTTRMEIETALFQVLIRFGAALMLAPIVDHEAVLLSDSATVSCSGFIYDLRTGYGGIPDHLTLEFAVKEMENQNDKSTKKRKKINVVDSNSKELLNVEINEDVAVDIGGGHRVLSRIKSVLSTVEDNDEENVCTTKIIAVPLSAQYGGPHFEFELGIEEYVDAKEAIAKELLDDATIE